MVSKISKLSFVISRSRIDTYLNYFSEEDNISLKELQAYNLYIWNIKISAAFLEVIGLYEVALRNAIIKALEPNYKAHSILNDNFIRALKPATREELINIVNKLSKNKKYECAFRNNRLQPLKIDTHDVSPGKVVAELNFVFWENMLSKTHRIRWINHFNKAFPNLKISNIAESHLVIDNIRQVTQTIRLLRNRICHHEPIFNENKINLNELFSNLKMVLSYISEDATHILNEFERVDQLLREKPKR